MKSNDNNEMEVRIAEKVYQRLIKDVRSGIMLLATQGDNPYQNQHHAASTRPLERFEAYQPDASCALGLDRKMKIDILKRAVQEKAARVSRLLAEVEEIHEIDVFPIPRRSRIDTLQYECENLSKMLADLLYQDLKLRHQDKSELPA